MSAKPLKIHTVRSRIANVHLVQDDAGLIVVDTGFASAPRQVLARIKQLGFQPQDVRLILLTHVHMDHAGGAAELRRLTGAPVAVHAADDAKARAGRHPLPSGRGRLGATLEKLSNEVGFEFTYEPFVPDLWLDEGQRLNDFSVKGSIVHTPGHTLGSLTLVLEDGIMLIGDALINQIRVGSPLYGEDLFLARTSIEKICRMRPRILYSGHGKPFSGQDVERYLARFERR